MSLHQHCFGAVEPLVPFLGQYLNVSCFRRQAFPITFRPVFEIRRHVAAHPKTKPLVLPAAPCVHAESVLGYASESSGISLARLKPKVARRGYGIGMVHALSNSATRHAGAHAGHAAGATGIIDRRGLLMKHGVSADVQFFFTRFCRVMPAAVLKPFQPRANRGQVPRSGHVLAVPRAEGLGVGEKHARADVHRVREVTSFGRSAGLGNAGINHCGLHIIQVHR